jgi:primosomal protein N' (replication factor Y)
MVCHNCQLKKQVLTECPECHSNKIKFLSGGTQKVEEYLQKAFSNKNIVRVDSDTITRKDQLSLTQKEFIARGIDIVIGTQMVSRGFYNTDSCVGLILADVLLHIPSYNASHRFYSIVMQLAAQSHAHHLILQTYTPDIPVMRYIAGNDYESFYANELHNRKEYGYPPFSKLYKIEIFHKDEIKLNKIADTIYADLKNNLLDKAIVNQPNVPYIPKRGDKYIREIQLKSHGEVHGIISDYYRNKAKEVRNTERDCYINIIVDSED